MSNPTGSSSPRRRPSQAVDLWRGFRWSFRRWVYENLNREALLSGLRQFALVAPLTLLIFVYAEQEQRRTQQSVPFVAEVQSANPAFAVTLLDPTNEERALQRISMTADLTGTQAKLEQVQTDLAKTNAAPLIVRINPTAAGRQPFPLAAIGQQAVFTNNFITVANPSPASLMVRIEPIVRNDVPLRLPPEVATRANNVVFDPPSVTLVGPQSAFEPAAPGGPPRNTTAIADVAQIPHLQDVGPPEATVNVLLPSPDLQVRIQPPAVKVKFDTLPPDAKANIPAVPIWVVISPTLSERFKVVPAEDSLKNVSVTGPADVINQLGSGQAVNGRPVVATITVTGADTAQLGQPRTQSVQYELPQGVHETGDSVGRQVTFRVFDRNQPDGGTP